MIENYLNCANKTNKYWKSINYLLFRWRIIYLWTRKKRNVSVLSFLRDVCDNTCKKIDKKQHPIFLLFHTHTFIFSYWTFRCKKKKCCTVKCGYVIKKHHSLLFFSVKKGFKKEIYYLTLISYVYLKIIVWVDFW